MMRLFFNQKAKYAQAQDTESAEVAQDDATVHRSMDDRLPSVRRGWADSRRRSAARVAVKNPARFDGCIRKTAKRVHQVEGLFVSFKNAVHRAVVRDEPLPEMVLHFEEGSELEKILHTRKWGPRVAPISHSGHTCHPLWQEFVRWAAARYLKAKMHREVNAEGEIVHTVRLYPLVEDVWP